jgi:holliday junction DNA helicase RuvA
VIASLTGEVLSSSNGQVVLDVSGVGYLIHSTPSVVGSVGTGKSVRFFTSLVVREDALTLFGFLDADQLEVFELLRSVNGVGPKSALAILGELSVDQIAQAVSSEADQVFKAVSGIGVKTAKLIVLTLAGKMAGGPVGNLSPSSEIAVAGLIGLGWSERQSREAVASVASPDRTDKELLKAALQILSKARKS